MAGEAAAQGIDLLQVVALLGAGVVAVPLFKRLGLGSVLGYLTAGLLIGPFGLRLVTDPEAILHIAELGVVMFLFVIGLEMQPSRLWNLRREILGLGVAQVVVCGALLTAVGIAFGYNPAAAFVAGMGFVLTSTAVVIQVLEERGQMAAPSGQRVVSILLLEDLAIVPLLAIVAFLAPAAGEVEPGARWLSVGIGLGALVVLVIAGRYLLNPMFRLLAAAKAREVMTAAALLVVLGASVLMQMGGLSMAMGAFLAGVLLSESTFRHQLEADIEPFRGILLGLFFISVGMSLDLGVVAAEWVIIAASVVGYMLLKGVGIYGVARLTRAGHREAVDRAVLMAQGGEFAFVLYAAAASSGIISGRVSAVFTSTVIISMVLTPVCLTVLRRLTPRQEQSMDGVELVESLHERILVIGFGRFGQIACQPLLALGHRISIIDDDTDMIRAAAQFGFKVYYGDGRRLDILRAAGVETADMVLICIDDRDGAVAIAELLRDEFPLVKVMARAYDRAHAIRLVHAGVEYQVREVFESALAFGRETALVLGASPEQAAETIAEVRLRDGQRFEMQLLGDLKSGADLLLKNARDQAREGGVVAAPSEPVVLEPASVNAPV